MTQKELLAQLSEKAGISKVASKTVLEALVDIACREARQGFTIPGLCRLRVVKRKARKLRNPRTGAFLILAEHDALRIKPVRRAAERVAPRPATLLMAAPAPDLEPAEITRLPETVAAPVAPPVELFLLSFACPKCRAEIEASSDLLGSEVQCPSCNSIIRVPEKVDKPTDGSFVPFASPMTAQQMFGEDTRSRTIRIELPLDSLAPAPPPKRKIIVPRREP